MATCEIKKRSTMYNLNDSSSQIQLILRIRYVFLSFETTILLSCRLFLSVVRSLFHFDCTHNHTVRLLVVLLLLLSLLFIAGKRIHTCVVLYRSHKHPNVRTSLTYARTQTRTHARTHKLNCGQMIYSKV